jgi:hypothetical protein
MIPTVEAMMAMITRIKDAVVVIIAARRNGITVRRSIEDNVLTVRWTYEEGHSVTVNNSNSSLLAFLYYCIAKLYKI